MKGFVSLIVFCCSFFISIQQIRAAVFYLDTDRGQDTHPGDSARPWRSLDKVNSTTFSAGDRILFRGGQTFNGLLYFDAQDAGTSANPIQIGSFGAGRARIISGGEKGIQFYNTAGFRVKNLTIQGNGSANNSASGILFYNDLPGNVKLSHIRIDSVEISGYGDHGILLRGANGLSGYRDVRINYALSHHNRWSGIYTYGIEMSSGFAHENIYVGNSFAHDNSGWDSLASMGGIVLSNVNGGTIERCVAYNNSSGPRYTGSNGPVGIWAYNSNNITIQFNESHHNGSGSGGDGGGFDLDWGVSNSVMQYNYSHDNDGAGFLVCEIFNIKPLSNVTVRYNISQNDSRKTGYGAIQIYNDGFGVSGVEVYNNTVFLSSAPVQPKAIVMKTPTVNVHVRNNIFMKTGNVLLSEISSTHTGLLLQNNNYWAADGSFFAQWNGILYSSLHAWRGASGQESGSGYSVDPQLSSPGTAGTLNDASLLVGMTQYRLKAGSPMINAGSNLAGSGINPGTRDYFGHITPQGAGYDIGAHEYIPADTSPGIESYRCGTSGANALLIRRSGWGAIGEGFVIQYRASGEKNISAGVYDLKGRLTASLPVDGRAGIRHTFWKADAYRNGVYIIVLRQGSGISSQKVAYVR